MTPAEFLLGANILDDRRCRFRVWAPKASRVEVLLPASDRALEMTGGELGYFEAIVEDVTAGTRYLYRLDSHRELPDPASRFQPEGVHGPSEVVAPGFDWTDQGFFGRPLHDYVIYELHVGTFTREGTFEAAIPELGPLKELGITAIELMPVAQFPGSRNWGYDGVFPFATQASYGGPAGLKRLVNAAHATGLSVVLDVVYNHLGPEGNYLGEYGPYFTDLYRTAWGQALNFDGPHSPEVRRFFIENALYWQTHFHIDALRLDAIHAIRDFSAVPFLEELAERCNEQAQALNRRFYLIGESDLNNTRHILPRVLGGYGLDAQWSDDFHHCLHALLTGEQSGYYADYGGMEQFARAWREGYAYTGQYSAFRQRNYGSSPRLNHAKQFVVCSQNHDQVGNRMLGDRLAASLSFESQKLAAASVLLSPFVPLLFMGEEYGETAPFQFFCSHSDPDLIRAVNAGRKEEFKSFRWQGEVPEPQDEATFNRSKLNHALAGKEPHRRLRDFYRALIRCRKALPALANAEKNTMEVLPYESERALVVHYRGKDGVEVWVALNYSTAPVEISGAGGEGEWRTVLDSSGREWGGPGGETPETHTLKGSSRLKLAPHSVLVLERI